MFIGGYMNRYLLILAVGLLTAGCNTLGDVKHELAKGGFALWYPAEAGVEPGQIWQVEDRGKRRIKQQRTPDALKLDDPVPASFETLKKTVDGSVGLDLGFTNGILGTAGDMAVLLKAGSVKKVELNFGNTEIRRMTLGDLRSHFVRSKLPPDYLADLQKLDKDDRNYVVIAAIVRSAGMKYVFQCEDTSQLEAKAPEISKAISADFKLKVVSKTEAVWEIPTSTPMVIGILPVYGRDLDLSIEEVVKRLETKHRVMDETFKELVPASAKIRFDDLR